MNPPSLGHPTTTKKHLSSFPFHHLFLLLLSSLLLTCSNARLHHQHLNHPLQSRSNHKAPLDNDAVVVASILAKGDITLQDCKLNDNCDQSISLGADPQTDTYTQQTDGTAKWKTLGLDSANLHVNRIAVGFVPAFNEKLYPNSPAQINAKLPAPMAIVGDYIELEPWSTDMKNFDWHLPIIKKLDGNPVWCIGLQPTPGLQTITEQVAQRIAQKVKHINDQGIVVWLRFAHEMNGEWYCWGMKPDLFKEKWNLIARAVMAVTDKTYMLWSPNAAFGNSLDDLHGGYTPYWPGADTVHIVGVSFYHWGRGADRVNVAPTDDEVVGKITELNRLYGSGGWGKPVIIAETAASYTYNRWSKTPVVGNSDEYNIKMRWLHLLLDKYIKKVVPNLRAMVWFEVIKDENATGNTPVRTEDFRLILGNPKVSWGAQQYFSKARKS